MKNHNESGELRRSRERFAELQRQKSKSVTYMIGRKRTTIIINMIIEILSGVIYGFGLFFIIQFLQMRKSHMGPGQYKIFIGAFTVISIGWFIYLSLKIRTSYKRLREVSAKRDR